MIDGQSLGALDLQIYLRSSLNLTGKSKISLQLRVCAHSKDKRKQAINFSSAMRSSGVNRSLGKRSYSQA